MSQVKNGPSGALEKEKVSPVTAPTNSNRRQFLGQVGVAASLAAGTLAAPAVASAQSAASSAPAAPSSVTNSRIVQAFTLRVTEATSDALVPAATNVNNGDDARYADKGGTYTKCLEHDQYGRVVPSSYNSFKKALASGEFSQFGQILLGGTRTLNGPQGGLAFDLEALDNVQFGQPQVPPAPGIASDQSATELLEHYWAALLRDVAFTDYETNAVAIAAAAELSSQPTYFGPRSGTTVTPNLLFRGAFPWETLGPYISQFFIKQTAFGAQPISQQMITYLPDIDYMANFADWLTVQNGDVTGLLDQVAPDLVYRRNGRDLAAFTHIDVLYQAYFVAYLVLTTIGAPLDPGNPYIGSKSENGFGTFGAPDFASTLAEVATKELNACWYQKWFVHLRPRPESIGGIVQLIKNGQSSETDVTLSDVILNSVGLQQSFEKYGTWLLSQAYPEGSPTHPAYPTGHGAVGGACITVLKFFYDGNHVIADPQVPADA